ncbi:MAG: hypothetical protein VST68_03775, partial [Nitrospirota bacterium]|nr:hypothetical protein [Nitrospirota bacterium]
ACSCPESSKSMPSIFVPPRSIPIRMGVVVDYSWAGQKGPSSPILSRVEGKAAGTLASGAYLSVRAHDKGPRTLLADFFNSPIP